jgi:hypothetical protein
MVSKVGTIAAVFSAVAGVVVAVVIGLQWMSYPGGLSMELRDAKTTLHRQTDGAGVSYQVMLSGEMAILNNNSRSVLVTRICTQQYDANTLNTLSKNEDLGCLTTELVDSDGNQVRYPITVPAYTTFLAEYQESMSIYNKFIVIAFETLVDNGMNIAELQRHLETEGYDLFGQRRWKGDTIWLPCDEHLPEELRDIGIVFTLETAEKVHRSCGMFLLDTAFLMGGRLGRAQTQMRIPLDAFRRRSGPGEIWEHEERITE